MFNLEMLGLAIRNGRRWPPSDYEIWRLIPQKPQTNNAIPQVELPSVYIYVPETFNLRAGLYVTALHMQKTASVLIARRGAQCRTNRACADHLDCIWAGRLNRAANLMIRRADVRRI